MSRGGRRGTPWQTTRVKPDADDLAPDGSEIRLLPPMRGASLCHCTLPPGGTSKAVAHRTIEELWYFLNGQGLVWRKRGDHEEEVAVDPGVCVTIPPGTHFQFRNSGSQPLSFVIVTIPPWPGSEEAVRVGDHWPV